MENTEQKTCQVPMHDNKPCGRQLDDSEKCICHWEREAKDAKLFQEELDKIFADEKAEYFDLTRFYFPKTGYKLPREYKKDVHFLLATFSETANFSGATFSGAAIFDDADFSGGAKFSWATFLGEAEFLGVTFAGKVDFGGARFLKYVNFFHCKIQNGSSLIFDGGLLPAEEKGQVFTGGAGFISCFFANPEKIMFRKLSLAKCRFLETDVSQAQFIDVKWSNKPKFRKWFPRNAVYDEVSIHDNCFRWLRSKIKKQIRSRIKKHKGKTSQPQYNLIAQLYRRLQANYINNYRYAEAGDFHIGELEMMRKAKKNEISYVVSNILYKYISFYGESFLRPLGWLAFVLLLFPAILLYDGINLNPAVQNPTVAETVNYEWSWSPGDFLPANNNSRGDYWEAFVTNFSLIAYSRSDIGKYLPESHTRFIVTIESLIVIALVAFFLLALRRRYKRKALDNFRRGR